MTWNSTLTRKTPLKATGARKREAKPMKRNRKGISAADRAYLNACRGQRCYLAIPGVCRGDIATVVPCHANWAEYGKGMGRKADHTFTVPGCMLCHAELDQGRHLTREQRRAVWESAYSEWRLVRPRVLNAKPAA